MNYKMPAEWEPHEGTWLSWPHNESHWPGKFELIPPIFARLARELAYAGEKVFICVNDEEMEINAHNLIGKEIENVFFFRIPTNTSWMRDHGPIFVHDKSNKRIITDWIFNTWGGKYPPWDNDNEVPQKISKIFNINSIETGIVLEGGSIDVNGKGTLITTKQCLLNENRNPNLSKEEIEKYLHDYLGATNVLWLEEGIVGDDTDGHIDDIARFVNENTIVCPYEENPEDENYVILKKNFEDLMKMFDQDGNLLNVIKIPMPDPVIYEGERLPASYANFYIANKAVLVPIFNSKQDRETLSIFEKLFPTKKIIGIDCTDLVWGLGTIHCSTQQQPL